MPITPLHLGLMAPANHWFQGKVSIISFTLVNLIIDQPAITAWFKGQPLPSHDEAMHTMLGAMVLAVILTIPGMRSMPWALGAFTGAITHILLDALVHPEMQPFIPVMGGNPIYMGWMVPLSLTLVPLTIWLIAQCVSSCLGWARKRLRPA